MGRVPLGKQTKLPAAAAAAVPPATAAAATPAPEPDDSCSSDHMSKSVSSLCLIPDSALHVWYTEKSLADVDYRSLQAPAGRHDWLTCAMLSTQASGDLVSLPTHNASCRVLGRCWN